MKIFFKVVLLLSLVTTRPAYSQMKLNSNFSFEESQVEVFYDCTLLDTVLIESKTYQAVLQIGPTITKFQDISAYARDSIAWNCHGDYSKINIGKLFGTYQPIDVTKYWFSPSENRFEEGGMISYIVYLVIDSMATQDWSISDEEPITICGYRCREATTEFRGRSWKVWFTEELPYSFGPWKLHGLPGLILKAEDDSHTIIYEAFALRKGTEYPIEKEEHGNHTRFLPREQLLDWQKMEALQPVEFKKMIGEGNITVNGEPFRPTRLFYCPLELN